MRESDGVTLLIRRVPASSVGVRKGGANAVNNDGIQWSAVASSTSGSMCRYKYKIKGK